MAKTEAVDASQKKIRIVDLDMARLGVHKGEKCFCIHPDVPVVEVPKFYLKENVRSSEDTICKYCGDVCMNGATRDKRSGSHHVGMDFMYCPEKGKAFRTANHPAGGLCIECKDIIGKSEVVGMGQLPIANSL